MTSSNPPRFVLQLLGSPFLRDSNGVVPPSLGWGKPLALLAVLASRGEARRDEIVDLLWRDVEEAKARNAFRQALHRLRSAIGEELLPQDREILRLTRSDRIAIDLHRFESAANLGNVDEAIQLYRGDFLEGVVLDEPPFDQWADQERNRMRARFRSVLEQTIARAQAAGQWADAIAHGRRLLDIAPYDEGAAKLAALTLVSAGRRAEARDTLLQFAARINAELGLSLPSELQSLLTRLEKTEPANTSVSAPRPADDIELPLAGREAELTQLLTQWRATSEDRGAIAVIEAAAGLGKSRLVRELSVNAKSLRRSLILQGRERAAAGGIPYAGFVEALRPLVRAPGIMGASRHLLAEASRLLPELRDSLELPPLTDVEDEAARVRFFEGVAALLDAAAYEQPVMLILEDVHDIGASSLDLLSYFSARLAGSAVMLVLTLDPDRSPAAVLTRVRGLVSTRGAGALSTTLAQLDPHALASSIHVHAPDVSIELAKQIAGRAGGNPAVAFELLRRVRSGESISRLPLSLRALIEERLHRLSSSQRRTFLVLSLFGRPVPLRVLGSASHVSDSAVAEVADMLVSEGLARRDADVIEAEPDAANAALDAAGSASRVFLAGWIGESLAGDARSDPAEVTRFFAMAGQQGPAFHYGRLAAFGAMRVGAWPEAVQHLQSARAMAGTADEAGEIEGLLSGLGAGNRRIPGKKAPSLRDSPAESSELRADSQGATTDDQSLWIRWFPNWRTLLGAAVATLVISAFVMARAPERLAPPVSRDTLVVLEGEPARTMRFVTGDLTGGFSLSAPMMVTRNGPAWADSLARPWTNVLAAPRGAFVVATRAAAEGRAQLYVLGPSRRDSLLLAREQADVHALGWSPDARWILVSISSIRGGVPDSDLYAIRADGSERRAIDTTSHRSVIEAAWSPDGSRIAWVARIGAERQQEVFTALSNGSAAENVTRHPADDYRIAWSGDGELLGFTSLRDGNAELYAFSIREHRLWRLTNDPAQDDRLSFSQSGRLVAFESTRGGVSALYVMAALGGEPQRVTHALPLSPLEWRGGGHRYLDRVRVAVKSRIGVGESADVRALGFDQRGDTLDITTSRLFLMDTGVAQVHRTPDGLTILLGRREGVARLVADVGRWRSDTALVRVGEERLTLIGGVPDAADWQPLGVPRPTLAASGVHIAADRDWESGVLSRSTAPLDGPLEFSVHFSSDSVVLRGTARLSAALVAPEEAATIDSLAPQFLRHASFTLDGEAQRVVYSVSREIFSEGLPQLGPRVQLTMRVAEDSTVVFLLDGRQRWRSSLKIVNERISPRAQMWIGARSAPGGVLVDSARVILGR